MRGSKQPLARVGKTGFDALGERTPEPARNEQDPQRAKKCVSGGLLPQEWLETRPAEGLRSDEMSSLPPNCSLLRAPRLLPASPCASHGVDKTFHDDLLSKSDFQGLGPVNSGLCVAVDCTCLADVNCLSSPTPALRFRSPSFTGSPLALATNGPNCVKAPLLAGRPAHPCCAFGSLTPSPPSGLGSPSRVDCPRPVPLTALAVSGITRHAFIATAAVLGGPSRLCPRV